MYRISEGQIHCGKPTQKIPFWRVAPACAFGPTTDLQNTPSLWRNYCRWPLLINDQDERL